MLFVFLSRWHFRRISLDILSIYVNFKVPSPILFASFNAKQIGLVKTASLTRVPKKIKRKIEDENDLM